MADLRKVRPGERLRFPADAYNAFVDAANWVRRNARSESFDASDSVGRNLHTIRVKPTNDIARFGIIGIDSILFTKEDNENEFYNGAAINGVTPAAATHLGRFVVALDPINAGKIGVGAISGIMPMKVDFGTDDVAGCYADVKDGDSEALKVYPVGSARVLWKEEGSGVKWALVRLGSPPEFLFVKCTKDGGDNGDGTTAATFTYTIKTKDDKTIAENVAVMTTRITSLEVTEATYGLAVKDGAVWKLIWTDESILHENC